MSLRKARLLYYVWTISIVIILLSTAGVLGWMAAIVVLIGALPMFGTVHRAAEKQTLRKLASGLGVDLNSPPSAPASQDHH